MKTSETINSLAEALCKAQGTIEAVKKDSKGYNYNYAKLESLIEMAKPVLMANELSIIQMPTNADESISVTTRVLHSSGEWLEDSLSMPVVIPNGMNHAQACGSLITYARRYAYAAILSIAQEDTDAHTGAQAAKSYKNEVKLCTEKQQQFIASLMKAKKIKWAEFQAQFKVEGLSKLSIGDAKKSIDWLQAQDIRAELPEGMADASPLTGKPE